MAWRGEAVPGTGMAALTHARRGLIKPGLQSRQGQVAEGEGMDQCGRLAVAVAARGRWATHRRGRRRRLESCRRESFSDDVASVIRNGLVAWCGSVDGLVWSSASARERDVQRRRNCAFFFPVFFHCLHGTGQQMRCQHLWLLFEDSTDVLTLSVCAITVTEQRKTHLQGLLLLLCIIS